MLGFETRVATRFLREGRVQTLLIIVGVAAGVAVIAYISALISGLQQNTLAKTLGAQAHVTLSPLDETVLAARLPAAPTTREMLQTQPRAQRPRSIVNWQLLVPLLEAMPEVSAVSPMVSAAGLATRGEASRAIALIGVDLDRYDRIVSLRTKVVEGRARLGPGEGIIGRELATDLGVRVGDRVSIVTGGVSDSFRITSLVDMGVRDLNRRTVIVPLRGMTGGISRGSSYFGMLVGSSRLVADGSWSPIGHPRSSCSAPCGTWCGGMARARSSPRSRPPSGPSRPSTRCHRSAPYRRWPWRPRWCAHADAMVARPQCRL